MAVFPSCDDRLTYDDLPAQLVIAPAARAIHRRLSAGLGRCAVVYGENIEPRQWRQSRVAGWPVTAPKSLAHSAAPPWRRKNSEKFVQPRRSRHAYRSACVHRLLVLAIGVRRGINDHTRRLAVLDDGNIQKRCDATHVPLGFG